MQSVQEILKHNRNRGQDDISSGIYSVCCTHPEVLKAAMYFCRGKDYPLVIESTSNQVDQYGGYTGMKPAEFVQYVQKLAAECSYPLDQLVLGGDHLGPNAWQGETGAAAMQKAEVLVADYVRAGYRKIHLDASMACAGDPSNEHGAISDELVAQRAAKLCRAAEQAWREVGGEAPFYIIGTEVPVPGGQRAEEAVTPTSPEAARQTYTITKQIFVQNNLEEVWPRVIAMVVQPGVEFGDEAIRYYQSDKARKLSQVTAELGLVFEAHSTDYQTPELLHQLVQDHYAILKVGPWLTYAYREALFGLSLIAEEMQEYGLLEPLSGSLKERLLAYLKKHPEYWQNYYKGNDKEIAYKCLYSLSDRIRYYWPQREVEEIVASLIEQLQKHKIPYSLVSQYFPALALLRGEWTAQKLIEGHIQGVLRCYEQAISL